jgi:hypothetical protein
MLFVFLEWETNIFDLPSTEMARGSELVRFLLMLILIWHKANVKNRLGDQVKQTSHMSKSWLCSYGILSDVRSTTLHWNCEDYFVF